MHIVDKEDFSTFIKPIKDRLEATEVNGVKPLTIEYRDKDTGEVCAKIIRLWEGATRTMTLEHYIND